MGNKFPFPRDVETVFTNFQASWWEAVGARLFGERFENWSGRFHMVAYYWRGKLYITKYGAV